MKKILALAIIASGLMAFVPTAEARDHGRRYKRVLRYDDGCGQPAYGYVQRRYYRYHGPVRYYRPARNDYYIKDGRYAPYLYSQPRVGVSFSLGR
jgi:hypothetical protein